MVPAAFAFAPRCPCTDLFPSAPPLLAALVRVVLASEAMLAELHQRVEALAAARKGRDIGPGDEDSDGEQPYVPAPAFFQPPAAGVAASAQATPAVSAQPGAPSGSQLAADAGAGGRAVSEAPSGSAATGPSQDLQPSSEAYTAPAGSTAITVADWADWLQQRRLGLRRPVGGDLRGRRYW